MSKMEFIQTVPWETDLEEPNMKHSAETFVEMIENSKKTLEMGEFYIHSIKGQPMENVLTAIKEAAKRGVKIRMIIDNFFYSMYPQGADSLNKIKNIEVRTIDMNALTGGIMHAKYIIADNMDVYLGSCNFDWLSLTNVHEIGVRIQNTKFASYVQKVFETDWELCITKKLPAIKKTKLKKLPVIETKYNNSKIKVTPVFSPASTTPNNCPIEIEEIVKYIDSAENSIFLNVMEYSPKSQYCDLYSDLFDSALRKAGVRGVNVKILASNWCMHEPNISFLKSISMIPNIEVKLFTIPRLKKQYLPFARVQHCKYLVIDKEKAWLGSSNWEPDYFLRSRNVSMLIQGFETTITLRQMFLNSWTSKYAEFIDSKKQYKRPQVMD